MKKFSYGNLQEFTNEMEKRFASKESLGAVATLDKVGMDNLADALKSVINGKADAATTLAGYGIEDGMTATEVAAAISTAIAGVDHLSRIKVTSIDEINISAPGADKKIYMVPKVEAEEGDSDRYDEYMIIDGKLEGMGGWNVNLADYVKVAQMTQAIINALTPNVIGEGNVITGIAYDQDTGKLSVKKELTALTEADFEEYTSEEIKSLFS